MAHLQNLDTLEVRSPIVNLTRRDGSELGLLLTPVWQRRFKSLWEYLQTHLRLAAISAGRSVTLNDAYPEAILLCTGTITLTLPASHTAGDRYYVFNNGTGVITISGTINGVAAGYELVNRYQYVEVTSLDGTNWIVTANN